MRSKNMNHSGSFGDWWDYLPTWTTNGLTWSSWLFRMSMELLWAWLIFVTMTFSGKWQNTTRPIFIGDGALTSGIRHTRISSCQCRPEKFKDSMRETRRSLHTASIHSSKSTTRTGRMDTTLKGMPVRSIRGCWIRLDARKGASHARKGDVLTT